MIFHLWCSILLTIANIMMNPDFFAVIPRISLKVDSMNMISLYHINIFVYYSSMHILSGISDDNACFSLDSLFLHLIWTCFILFLNKTMLSARTLFALSILIGDLSDLWLEPSFARSFSAIPNTMRCIEITKPGGPEVRSFSFLWMTIPNPFLVGSQNRWTPRSRS